MNISHESAQQTQARLERVLALAECRTFAAAYAFVQTPADAFPELLTSTALGFVRDDEVWRALVPSDDATAERFFVFSFHFPAGLDNSGFVGWLTISNFGFASISRPTMNFCRLPPESDLAAASGPLALTL